MRGDATGFFLYVGVMEVEKDIEEDYGDGGQVVVDWIEADVEGWGEGDGYPAEEKPAEMTFEPEDEGDGSSEGCDDHDGDEERGALDEGGNDECGKLIDHRKDGVGEFNGEEDGELGVGPVMVVVAFDGKGESAECARAEEEIEGEK